MVAKKNMVIQYTQYCQKTRELVWSTWIDYVWEKGAGLGPRVQLENPGGARGCGSTRWIPILKKTGIREKIISVNYPRRLIYTVKNPSWIFPVNFHLGQVDFIPLGPGHTRVLWTIEIQPRRARGWLVKSFIRLIIPRYLKRLARECGRSL